MNQFLFKHPVSLLCVFWLALSLSISSVVLAEDPLTSAKTIALGNIQGFNFSSEAIFENPASLQLHSKASFGSFFTTYMSGENKSTVFSAAYTLSPDLTLGTGYIQNSIDNLLSTQENSSGEFESTGAFGFKESHYLIGGSYTAIPNLSLGLSSVYISQSSLS